MGLIQKNAKYNWNLAFKKGSDKKFPSLELVRLESIFLKGEKNSKLLEYGFGSGCNTIFLLEQGYKVVGVDISNYAKGVYFLQFVSDDIIKTKRILLH